MRRIDNRSAVFRVNVKWNANGFLAKNLDCFLFRFGTIGYGA